MAKASKRPRIKTFRSSVLLCVTALLFVSSLPLHVFFAQPAEAQSLLPATAKSANLATTTDLTVDTSVPLVDTSAFVSNDATLAFSGLSSPTSLSGQNVVLGQAAPPAAQAQCNPDTDANCKAPSWWDTTGFVWYQAWRLGLSKATEAAKSNTSYVFNCGFLASTREESLRDPATAAECAKQKEEAAKSRQEILDALNPLTQALESLKRAIKEMLTNAFKTAFTWLVQHAFSSEATMFNPVLNCDNRSNPDVACSPWFVQQMSLMATIGAWIVLPLMALVAMQAVIRGSMFMMTRAFFIMLPVAIVGTVMIAFMAQLLLNISDDFSEFIISSSLTGAQLDRVIKGFTTLNTPEGGGFLWQVLFLAAGLIGIVVIFIELMLREIGVYLSALFLPLAFAGLVWPASAKWAQQLVQVLIGLIFAKVFIVAALALGLSTIAGLAPGTEEAIEPTVSVMGTLLATLFVAIVAPSKLWTFVPGGEGAEHGRIATPGSVKGKGEGVGMLINKRLKVHQGRVGTPVPRAGSGVP